MNTEQRNTLEDWVTTLTQTLDLGTATASIDDVLELAGTAAHSVMRPAAPLTTYLVGVAVGRAIADGAHPQSAYDTAAAAATAVAEGRQRAADDSF